MRSLVFTHSNITILLSSTTAADPEKCQSKMKYGGFRHGVKPKGPLSKRRRRSACMNACEENDQLIPMDSPAFQENRRRNRDDSI